MALITKSIERGGGGVKYDSDLEQLATVSIYYAHFIVTYVRQLLDGWVITASINYLNSVIENVLFESYHNNNNSVVVFTARYKSNPLFNIIHLQRVIANRISSCSNAMYSTQTYILCRLHSTILLEIPPPIPPTSNCALIRL